MIQYKLSQSHSYFIDWLCIKKPMYQEIYASRYLACFVPVLLTDLQSACCIKERLYTDNAKLSRCTMTTRSSLPPRILSNCAVRSRATRRASWDEKFTWPMANRSPVS